MASNVTRNPSYLNRQLTVDRDVASTDAGTYTALSIDLDKTGASTSINTINGLHIAMDNTTATDGTNIMTGISCSPTLTHADDNGASIIYGASFFVVGNNAGSTHTSVGIGMRLDVSGSDVNNGILLDCDNTGKEYDIRIESSADNSDYFDIKTIANGATTITTVHDGGANAHLTLDIDGTLVLNANVLVQDTKRLYLSDVGGEYLSGDGTDLTIVSGNDITLDAGDDIVLDAEGDITLDSATGKFPVKNNGTEFSVADSAYAGMILGYTTVGIDAADDAKTLGTAFAVTDSNHNVSFIAPPSGVVEIFVSIYGDINRRNFYFGLSVGATYNALDVTHEHIVATPPSVLGHRQINHRWVITGLTAGDTYKYWLGARSTHNFSITLRWGGDVTDEYAPFIMKATALPTAVADYAVYG